MANENLYEVVNECCGRLPEHYELVIRMENGCACVEVEYDDGYNIEAWDIDGADMSLAEQLMVGLQEAIDHDAELD